MAALTVGQIDARLSTMAALATNPDVTPELRRDMWRSIDNFLDRRNALKSPA